MFTWKPDFPATRDRMEAFWERSVLDRPLVMFGLEKPPAERVPLPTSHHSSPAERWMDSQYQTEYALASLSNRLFLGDTLPIAYPNLGPELFSALYGCPLHFGDYGTSWTDPVLEDWNDADKLQLDWNHPLLQSLHDITDALLAVGRGNFIVGMTDWHPGGDAIAAFRDPARFATDLIEYPEQVKRLLGRIEADYFRLYDIFYTKLRAAGMPITSWLPLFSEGKYYIPSNDFSIMIRTSMFNEFFLPGIIRECQFLDRSIYHLDGPGALRHLDTILSIPELDALQWVPGAGNEGFARWIPVYQEAQRRGKSIFVYCTLDDMDAIMQALDPRGLCLDVSGVPDAAAGEALLQQMTDWTREKA